MSTAGSTFGQRLAYYRATVRGISQRELEKKTGIDERVILRYEKDRSMPGLWNFALLVRALEVPADYLLPDIAPDDGRRREEGNEANG